MGFYENQNACDVDVKIIYLTFWCMAYMNI